MVKAPLHPLYEQPWPEGEFCFMQMGFVVTDVVTTAMRWATVFGVGPFLVLPRLVTPCTHRGKEVDLETQLAVAWAGPVQIELIQQHSDGPSIFRDLYGPDESGFHQLCTVSYDFGGKVAYFKELGYEVAGSIDARGHRVAYIDTVADFGFFTEIVEYRPEFLQQLAQMADTCAHWDGTDPVRLLTRDGYRTP
jgi:hypothetical protein